jgi:GrpB-like predicted nucleotidyltransferase (UPF0157 family)
MSNKKILIEEYNASWALEFQQLRSVYLRHLGDVITDIQHVGSTSVAGLAAKPIIDIDLIIINKDNLDTVIEKLQLLGYHHLGDLGISDREAFKPGSGQVPYDGYSRSQPKHNLYVCLANSDSLKNHIAFRDFLRSNPEKARAYGNLKKRLASENPYDIDRYVERKTPFIIEVLRQVGFDEVSLSRITKDNRIHNLKNNR